MPSADFVIVLAEKTAEGESCLNNRDRGPDQKNQTKSMTFSDLKSGGLNSDISRFRPPDFKSENVTMSQIWSGFI